MKNKHSGQKRHNTPAQLANLRVFGQLSPEEQRELSSRGGKAAQAVLREKRNFKKAVQWLMDMDAFETDNAAVEGLRKNFPDISNAEAMTAALMYKAMIEGDARAYAVIRDTSGEVPTTSVSTASLEPITINIKTVE